MACRRNRRSRAGTNFQTSQAILARSGTRQDACSLSIANNIKVRRFGESYDAGPFRCGRKHLHTGLVNICRILHSAGGKEKVSSPSSAKIPLKERHLFASLSRSLVMLVLLALQDRDSMASEGIESSNLPTPDFLFGSTAAMQELRMQLEQAEAARSPLFIEGENGTGKELLARYLHMRWGRSSGAFVRVNCGAMPAQVLEMEMFGSEKPSLQEQQESHSTSIGLAAGGTLFLDEITDMDPSVQRMLARVLEPVNRPTSGARDWDLNAGIICASIVGFEEALKSERLSREMAECFRLRVRLLPLRERKQDIPKLCQYLAAKLARSFGRPIPVLKPYVLSAFEQWSWPGNIRELENWIARIVIFGTEEAIGLEFMRQIGARTASYPHRSFHGAIGRHRRSGRRIQESKRDNR